MLFRSGLSVRAGRGSGLVFILLYRGWRGTEDATAAPAATRRLARSRHFSEAAVQIPNGDSHHRNNNKDLNESIHNDEITQKNKQSIENLANEIFCVPYGDLTAKFAKDAKKQTKYLHILKKCF